jgi:hypothetical protein
MLIKGTLEKNTLTTELGDFNVSREGDSQSVEKTVDVNGMSFQVHVPVTKAKINAIYTLLTQETNNKAPEDKNHLHQLVRQPVMELSSPTFEKPKPEIQKSEGDEVINLFGKPLEELEDYKIDPTLNRDLQTKMKQILLKSEQFYFRIHDQVWVRK